MIKHHEGSCDQICCLINAHNFLVNYKCKLSHPAFTSHLWNSSVLQNANRCKEKLYHYM
jgi:hypothetical protein